MARRYLSLASIVLALASFRTGGARTTEHALQPAAGERAAAAGLAAAVEPTMTAHFMDVGQGLSVLLEFPCGAVLIDAGAADAEHADALVDYLSEFFDHRTDSDVLSSIRSQALSDAHTSP
jgi:beta-lactamase superfamily II metal-dependent hydrolase